MVFDTPEIKVVVDEEDKQESFRAAKRLLFNEVSPDVQI